MRTTTYKICIMLLLFCIVAAGCYIGSLLLIRAKVKSIADHEALVEEESVYTNENAGLRSLLKDIGPGMDHLYARAVDSGDTVSFIESIEGLARDSGLSVKVNSITTSEVAGQKKYQMMLISVGTAGSWTSTYRFIALIESLPYKISLGSIALNHSQTTDAGVSRSVWSASLDFGVLQKIQ